MPPIPHVVKTVRIPYDMAVWFEEHCRDLGTNQNTVWNDLLEAYKVKVERSAKK